MVSLTSIQNFLSAKEIAVAGASRNPRKFGNVVLKELQTKGYNLYPINPNADSINDLACYKSVSLLPPQVTHLYIVTKPDQTMEVLKDAINRGIRNVWIQLKSDTPKVLEKARQHGIDLVYGECIIMHIEPTRGFHKFHKSLRRFFGKMPK
jgi:uncharacterized protein